MNTKKHPLLRILLMKLFFTLGIVLIVLGWKMTGNLNGLFIMLAGIGFLLGTLATYNKPFTR